MPVSSHGRVPRARLDPIACVGDALAVFSAQMSRPLRDETLVMLLDDLHYGSTLITVTDTFSSDQLIEVAEAMAFTARSAPDISGLVLASVRPGHGLLDDDDVTWDLLDEVVAESGLVLIDWLVIGRRGTDLPREMSCEASRWPADQ